MPTCRSSCSFALPLLLAVACGGSQGEPEPGGPDAGTVADEHVPVFLSFGTNVSKLTEGEAVLFTAVLTDPDGIDDLIGGSLTSEDGMIQYGAFATSGQEGSYTLSLPWAAIHQSADISFKTVAKRKFKAAFFDVLGHRIEKTAEVTLTCNGQYACHGECAASCGVSSTTRASCTGACTADQMTCDAGDTDRRAFYGSLGQLTQYGLSTCASTPPATYSGQPFYIVECLCVPAD